MATFIEHTTANRNGHMTIYIGHMTRFTIMHWSHDFRHWSHEYMEVSRDCVHLVHWVDEHDSVFVDGNG